MRKFFRVLALSAGFCGVAYAVPRTINWSSNFSGLNFLSDGTKLEDSADTFVFSLGASTVALNAERSNLAEWAAGWRELKQTTYDKVNWQFIDTATLADNSTFTAGEQAYIWGYNKTAIESDTEWIIMADEAWKFGQVDDNPHEDDWTVGSAPPAAALVGSINAGDGSYHMLFANALAQIPEPASACLLALALWPALRRRRSDFRAVT